MHLVGDLLDREILDRHGEPVGRVDDVILECPPDGPPRIAYLEVSGATRARRLHPRLGAWVERWRARHGPPGSGPLRIPWSAVRMVGTDVLADVEAERTPAWAWERWLRDHVIARIPGS